MNKEAILKKHQANDMSWEEVNATIEKDPILKRLWQTSLAAMQEYAQSYSEQTGSARWRTDNPQKSGNYITEEVVIDDRLTYNPVSYNYFDSQKEKWICKNKISKWLDESAPNENEDELWEDAKKIIGQELYFQDAELFEQANEKDKELKTKYHITKI